MSFKVPKRFNPLYALGGVLLFALTLQILTGISIAIHYTPAINKAFISVNVLMRKFKYGWLARTAHVNGASLLFCALYAHIFRAIYYRSYIGARRIVWLVGSIIYMLIMCVSFMGYVLPWGQLSYWAAVVITSFIESVPFVGKWLKLLVLGGYAVRDTLLKRFFVFHCFLPLLVLSLVLLHIALVHSSGQNDCIPNRTPLINSRINMFPAYLLKDLAFVCLYMLILCALCLVFPDTFSNKLNLEPADFYNTPPDIRPEWYFMHYYSVLRVFESKLLGMLIIGLTLICIVSLPYTHEDLSSNVLKSFYRPCVIVLFLSFVLLGVLGALQLNSWLAALAKLCSFSYLLFFLWPIGARMKQVVLLEMLKWLY